MMSKVLLRLWEMLVGFVWPVNFGPKENEKKK